MTSGEPAPARSLSLAPPSPHRHPSSHRSTGCLMETGAERQVPRQRARRAEAAVEVLVAAGVFGRVEAAVEAARPASDLAVAGVFGRADSKASNNGGPPPLSDCRAQAAPQLTLHPCNPLGFTWIRLDPPLPT